MCQILALKPKKEGYDGPGIYIRNGEYTQMEHTLFTPDERLTQGHMYAESCKSSILSEMIL